MPHVRRRDASLVASRGKPPHRNWVPWFWKLLKPAERHHLRSVMRLSSSTRPRAPKPRALEGLSELKRIMPMPPGRIGQMREDLIQRVEPGEGE